MSGFAHDALLGDGLRWCACGTPPARPAKMRIGLSVVVALWLFPTAAHADELHAAAGIGVWGFAQTPDFDGLGLELALADQIGVLRIGGRLVTGGELKINLLGEDDMREPDGVLDIGPTIGVVQELGPVSFDAAACPAYVRGRKRDAFATAGFGFEAGIGVRVHRWPRSNGLLGVRFVGDANPEHSFGGVILAFALTRR